MKKNLLTDQLLSHAYLERIIMALAFLFVLPLWSSAQCDGGTLDGGPFEFCVDGTPDMVSGITLNDNTTTINNAWVITDEAGLILGLPPMPGVVDFDGAGAGVCLIWNLAYEDGLTGLMMGSNVADLVGCHGFSNSISVTRTEVNGGTLEGGPFDFCVDGTPDMVSGITLTGNDGMINSWVVTDEAGNILGLPPMPGVVDFDGAGPGVCLIWNISYQDSLEGLVMGSNVSDLVGCYGFSNSITVTRSSTNGGVLAGGPFEFCVDGTPDMVSDITLTGNEGSLSQWVVTDAAGLILGLPPMPGVVDFDEAGAGVCLIWNVSYEEGLSGLEGGQNINDLDGCYGISNAVTVVRTNGGAACDEACLANGGVLEGGPFEFCVDGTPDMVSDITLNGNEGANSSWVVTDVDGNILGLPPMPGAVNFDDAGPGVCLIWNVSHEDDLMGLEADGNIFTGLQGCFSISNAITVTRIEVNGGTLEGGPFDFCVDGTPDMVSGITLSGNDGLNNSWVITDEDGKILGLPPMPGVVDFDGAGAGVCLIWNVSYQDSLSDLAVDNNIFAIEGCHGRSNSISVRRTAVNGGTLEGGPFDFCVDGTPDMVSGITLSGNDGMNNSWVVTDTSGNILGLPPMPGVVDFDGAGPGICLIWNISYQDGLEGLAMGNNVSDVVGCYGFSNPVTVTRTEVNGGTLEGGPFNFCVDGTPDMVSGITLTGNDGMNNSWVVTDELGNILGLPPMPGVVDFDGAGPGVCLIWNVSYQDSLEGLAMGGNVSDLVGCYGFSNSITVTRSSTNGGVLEGGPFEFCVDGTPDMVSDITLTGNEGSLSQWVVTDAAGLILGLPPMPGVVDFDEAGAGICLIWNVSYEEGLTGLEGGQNINDLDGCYGISNAVTVVRTNGGAACDEACLANGGVLAGGPFEFCVDGTPDMVSDITLNGNEGANSSWVVTDVDGNILGLPPMPGAVNFDDAGPGVCLIWNVSHEDDLMGLEADGNIFTGLQGCYSISNAITVTRIEVNGGTLEGGPFEFCVDGEADMVSGITLSGNDMDNNAWVVTDTSGNILGLPPMPGVVNFDEAGPGICLIWNISYTNGLEGLAGGNNVSDLVGCYGFSNPVTVTRNQVSGGTLEGGPFNFCVDGEADMVSGITLSGNDMDNNAWVVTDTSGNILGLPPMPGAVNFDEAGPGVCLIWNISYQDGLVGLAGGNNVSDLDGCYGFSNPVTVNRSSVEGGVLEGGPFEFCVDGEEDNVSGITLAGNEGELSAWVVTDTLGNILGLPPMPGAVNFDEAGPGVCYIWNISYTDGLDGLAMGNNVSGLSGCFALSNPVVVVRKEPIAGELIGQLEYEFCVDDTPDFIGALEVTGNSGDNGQWVVIDDETDIILGLPDSPQDVDFNQAGEGVCIMGFISYSDGIEGLVVGGSAEDVFGCISATDEFVEVTRVTSGDVCTTSTEEEELFNKLNVFPNPASNIINLEVETFDGANNISWSLLDGLGRQLKKASNVNSNTTLSIDVNDIQSGIYYIKIGVEERYILKKISILK